MTLSSEHFNSLAISIQLLAKRSDLGVVKGRDIFVSLPTGEDKSLCYATLPLVFDSFRWYLQSHLEQEFSGGCIALVASPLLALMKDQLATFEPLTVFTTTDTSC